MRKEFIVYTGQESRWSAYGRWVVDSIPVLGPFLAKTREGGDLFDFESREKIKRSTPETDHYRNFLKYGAEESMARAAFDEVTGYNDFRRETQKISGKSGELFKWVVVANDLMLVSAGAIMASRGEVGMTAFFVGMQTIAKIGFMGGLARGYEHGEFKKS